MAEYIDRDKMLERLKFKRDTDNIYKKKYAGLECAIAQCLKAPTADVVPRSEVMKYINNCYDKCEECRETLKIAFAREIFEEIEEMSEVCEYREVVSWKSIAELKKKYIGE